MFADDVTDAERTCGFEVIDTPKGKRVIRGLSRGLRAIKVKRSESIVEYVICGPDDQELYQPARTLRELRERFART